MLQADNLKVQDFANIGDDALGAAEPDRKILQILRARHHRSVGMPVVGQRNGHLFRDIAINEIAAATAINAARHRAGGGRQDRHSAAGTTGSIRRLCKACSR